MKPYQVIITAINGLAAGAMIAAGNIPAAVALIISSFVVTFLWKENK